MEWGGGRGREHTSYGAYHFARRVLPLELEEARLAELRGRGDEGELTGGFGLG